MAPNFQCPICLDSPNFVESTLCGHLFCSACLASLFDAPNPQCAICRRSLNSEDIENVDVAFAASLREPIRPAGGDEFSGLDDALAASLREPPRPTGIEDLSGLDDALATSLTEQIEGVRAELWNTVEEARRDLCFVDKGAEYPREAKQAAENSWEMIEEYVADVLGESYDLVKLQLKLMMIRTEANSIRFRKDFGKRRLPE